MDEYSRYLLLLKGLPGTGYDGAIPAFKRLFQDYGLPRAIKSDNGVPFATPGIATTLTVVHLVDQVGDRTDPDPTSQPVSKWQT